MNKVVLIIVLLIKISGCVYSQENYRIEQNALNYLLNKISVTDTSFKELKFITEGKMSCFYTQYDEFCGYYKENLRKDSLLIFKIEETKIDGYWKNYNKQPRVQLKVPDNYLKPKKIKKKQIKLKKFIEITSISHKVMFKEHYYVTIKTKFLHDERGVTINLKLDKTGEIKDYCLSFWIS